MKKKITTILAAGALSLAVTGCSAESPDAEVTPTTAPSAAVESGDTTLAPAATPQTIEPVDYSYAYEKYEPDMVVATVEGIDVTWEEYFYWGLNSYLYAEQVMGPITDFTTEISEGVTMNDFIVDGAEASSIQYRAIENNAALEGIELSETSKTAIAEQRELDIANYSEDGTEEGFIDYLATSYTSMEMYEYINNINALIGDIYAVNYGEDSELVTDEDAMQFVDENSIMVAKHVLFKKTDEMNELYTDEEIEAIRAEAQSVLEQILAEADPVAAFDTYITEYNEDPGMASYPDGYCFGLGEMVVEFETATQGLAVDEVTTELVETDFGFHIILRGEATADSILMSAGAPIRQVVASNEFNNKLNAWVEASTIEYVDGFTPDFGAIFAK